MTSEVRYFITFALGMAAFWLSGWVNGTLAQSVHHNLSSTLGLAITAAIYGGVLAMWSLIVLRRLAIKALVVGIVLAVVLGVVAAQVILHSAAGHIHTMFHLGVLTFVLYLCYGLIYALSLTVIRKLAGTKKSA